VIKPGLALLACLSLPAFAAENQLSAAIARDYKASLEPLFNHLHANPELSYMEVADGGAHGERAARGGLRGK
jgi:hippurate hydrolase